MDGLEDRGQEVTMGLNRRRNAMENPKSVSRAAVTSTSSIIPLGLETFRALPLCR